VLVSIFFKNSANGEESQGKDKKPSNVKIPE
jgi:hypothetical protein